MIPAAFAALVVSTWLLFQPVSGVLISRAVTGRPWWTGPSK